MSTPITPSSVSQDGMIANVAYHAAVVTGLAIGFAKLTKMVINKTSPAKLELDVYDIGMAIIDVGIAIVTKEMLINAKYIPADIVKSIVVMAGDAILDAAAFSGGNALFSI